MYVNLNSSSNRNRICQNHINTNGIHNNQQCSCVDQWCIQGNQWQQPMAQPWEPRISTATTNNSCHNQQQQPTMIATTNNIDHNNKWQTTATTATINHDDDPTNGTNDHDHMQCIDTRAMHLWEHCWPQRIDWWEHHNKCKSNVMTVATKQSWQLNDHNNQRTATTKWLWQPNNWGN